MVLTFSYHSAKYSRAWTLHTVGGGGRKVRHWGIFEYMDTRMEIMDCRLWEGLGSKVK